MSLLESLSFPWSSPGILLLAVLGCAWCHHPLREVSGNAAPPGLQQPDADGRVFQLLGPVRVLGRVKRPWCLRCHTSPGASVKVHLSVASLVMGVRSLLASSRSSGEVSVLQHLLEPRGEVRQDSRRSTG